MSVLETIHIKIIYFVTTDYNRQKFLKISELPRGRARGAVRGIKGIAKRGEGVSMLARMAWGTTQIILLVFVFYCQCLIRSCRRKYSPINV